MDLNAAFSQRYMRHLLLPEIGESGQLKLSQARVLLVGAGGLAAPAALYLAAGGVGCIGVVDDDIVEISNLQRQVLFSQADLGRSKLEVMKERLLLANPELVFEGHKKFLTGANADEILCGYDLAIDCTDNFAARYALNDACLKQAKRFVYGGLHRFEGQVSVFGEGGPCYRCLFPEISSVGAKPGSELETGAVAQGALNGIADRGAVHCCEFSGASGIDSCAMSAAASGTDGGAEAVISTGIFSCAEAGVLGVLPGIIGSLQALEAIKLILSLGDCLRGRLLTFDGLSMRFDQLRLAPEPNCVCRQFGRRIEAEPPNTSATVVPALTHSPSKVRSLSCEELRSRLDAGEKLLLLDVRTGKERRVMRFSPSYFAPLPVKQEELPAWLAAGAAHCTGAADMPAELQEGGRGEGRCGQHGEERDVQHGEGYEVLQVKREAASLPEPQAGLESEPQACPPSEAPPQLVVYCRSGQRSLQATALLNVLGADAVNLEGGILAWYKLYQDYYLASDVSGGEQH